MRASVVIPTYNRPLRLQQTLATVRDQTIDDYEIIVVDDGSEDPKQDEILAEAERFGNTRVLRGENAGPAAARNRGWQSAEGEFVLFTDDDCLVPDDWVERLVEGFSDGIGGVGGSLLPTPAAVESSIFAQLHDYRNRQVYEQPSEEQTGGSDLAIGGTANVAYRRSALSEVGGFDESFPTAAGEDADLEYRIVQSGYRLKYVPITVEHNDSYDWRSFVERSVRHGAGNYYYHKKHGPERPLWRVCAGLLATPLAFPAELFRSKRLAIAFLLIVKRGLSRTGELQAAWGSRHP